jgi:hypothetical protein
MASIGGWDRPDNDADAPHGPTVIWPFEPYGNFLIDKQGLA